MYTSMIWRAFLSTKAFKFGFVLVSPMLVIFSPALAQDVSRPDVAASLNLIHEKLSANENRDKSMAYIEALSLESLADTDTRYVADTILKWEAANQDIEHRSTLFFVWPIIRIPSNVIVDVAVEHLDDQDVSVARTASRWLSAEERNRDVISIYATLLRMPEIPDERSDIIISRMLNLDLRAGCIELERIFGTEKHDSKRILAMVDDIACYMWRKSHGVTYEGDAAKARAQRALVYLGSVAAEWIPHLVSFIENRYPELL